MRNSIAEHVCVLEQEGDAPWSRADAGSNERSGSRHGHGQQGRERRHASPNDQA